MSEAAELKRVAAQAVALAGPCGNALAASLVIGTGLFAACDIFLDPPTALRVGSLVGLLTLYLELLVTAQALVALGRRPAGWDPRRPTMGRYPRAFAVSLVVGAAALAGLVLFVLPGLVLLLRWSLALPIVLAEDEGVAASLRRSWALTRGRAPLLAGYGLLVLAGYAAAILLMVLTYPGQGRVPVPAAVAGNLAMISSQLFGWLITAALYAHLKAAEEAQAGPAT